MRQRWRTRIALTSAAAGLIALTFAPPAWGDPPGANGTVKIDGVEFDDWVPNEPHPPTCSFQVQFFGFDTNEKATITFSAQPPASADFTVLKTDKDVVISDDAAGGAALDPDTFITYTTTELGLNPTDFYLHPQQGYHVKLTITSATNPALNKHKVFWLPPCKESGSSPPGPPPSSGGGGGGGGGLPLTGIPVASIAVLGGGLLAAGLTLLVLYRRRAQRDAA
jgi:hypothetical protein